MGRFTVLFVVAALVLVACTPESDVGSTTTASGVTLTAPSETTSTEAPTTVDREAVIGVGQAVLTLNPFSDNAFEETEVAGQAVWATVYDIVPGTWERVPVSVTSLPSQTPGAIEVSDDDAMTVRYEVRQGATWSDGTPITGSDIAFTAQVMSELAASGSQSVDPIMATLVTTDSVERLAWITFSEPSFAFEDALSVILPSHAIETSTDFTNADGFDWPSGGPFMVDDSEQPNALTLVRNPHYWKTDDSGQQLPYVDRLRIVSGEEPGREVELFTSGTVDVIVVPPDPDAIDSVPTDATIQQVPTPVLEHLTFQFGEGRDTVNPQSSNDLLDYRMAIAHAIDRSALINESAVPWLPETPGVLIPLGRSAWEMYPHDPSAGSALVENVNGGTATGGPPVAVLSTTGNGDYRIRVGDALVDSFRVVGVGLETSYLDSLIFFGEQLGAGEFDVGMWAWVSNGGYGSQVGLMEQFDPASEASDKNFGNWGKGASPNDGTTEFSELVAEARVTVDRVRFHEIIQRAEEILAENLPLIPLFHRSSVAAIWSDELSGVAHNGSTSRITWNVETWHGPSE